MHKKIVLHCLRKTSFRQKGPRDGTDTEELSMLVGKDFVIMSYIVHQKNIFNIKFYSHFLIFYVNNFWNSHMIIVYHYQSKNEKIEFKNKYSITNIPGFVKDIIIE